MAKIFLRNINLEFPKTYNHDRSIRNRITKLISKKEQKFEVVSSLKNVNLDLSDGDIVGLVGPNGSGKSSLLRVISGIYYPNSGDRIVNGKILTLLDLHTGIEDENTGYENIFLLSYLRGYKKSEIQKLVGDIIEFSELGEAIFKPVRTYSSGMISRLSSSMILHFKSDIILLDEFISTGDKNYREKFSTHMLKKIKNSKIVVFASHDETMLKKICNRIFKIELGILKEISFKQVF